MRFSKYATLFTLLSFMILALLVTGWSVGVADASALVDIHHWVTDRSLPQSLNWFSVAGDDANGGRIIVLGGRDASGHPTRRVLKSAIQPDGSLAGWQDARQLPRPLLGQAATIHNGIVYIAGGWDGDKITRKVYYANADDLNWSSGEDMPEGVYLNGMAVVRNKLYVVAGYSERNVGVNKIFRADLAGDVKPIHWREITPVLPVSQLYRHSVVTYHDVLYVVGGYNGQQAVQDIYYSKVDSNGNLGPWRHSTMPVAREYAQAVIHDGKLMVLGGRSAGGVLNRVDTASFDADGRPVTWQRRPDLPKPLYLFGAASIHKYGSDYIFVLGGKDSDKQLQKAIYHSDAPPAPDHPSSLSLPLMLRKARSTPAPTSTPTATSSPTFTPTPSPTMTPTYTPSPTPTPVQRFIWWDEIENGRLIQPIGVEYSSQASACGYIYTTDDWSEGGAELDFHIPTSGYYYVWVRAMGLGWSQNSFFISIDGGQDNHFEILPKDDATWDWWWSPAPPPDEYTDPTYFYSGDHTIRFKSREGGARLDAVLITNDGNYTPTEFTDCGNSWTNPADGQEYVYVPAGEFLMGSTTDDSLSKYQERPQHTVYLDGYWIAKTEITNAQFARFLNAMGNQSVDGIPWFRSDAPDVKIEYRNGQWRVKSGWENHPAVNMSWHGAQAYAQWTGARLPTEAEWEKAARGANARRFPWGDATPDCSILNFFYNNDFCIGTTTPVGSYPAGISSYDALDMAGNVWEWVNDRYDDRYYSYSPYYNPQGPSSGHDRILRGGSWGHNIVFVRSAYRAGYDPNVRFSNTGFRPAVTK